MVAAWVRRDFSGTGVTQYPPGRHLRAVAERLEGHALLCIDVSGSMAGTPLREAVAGGLEFLTEAEQAGYRCGLVLWHHDIAAYLPTTTPSTRLRLRLRGAHAGGGNQLRPTLLAAIKELGPMAGDRVVCVFGDGDVGNEAVTASAAADARSLGIRFVVRGLGGAASASLARALTPDEPDESVRTVDVAGMRAGIRSMAASLRPR